MTARTHTITHPATGTSAFVTDKDREQRARRTPSTMAPRLMRGRPRSEQHSDTRAQSPHVVSQGRHNLSQAVAVGGHVASATEQARGCQVA